MKPQRGTLGKVTRGIIPQVAKRITFDLKIIETLYTSLRQITIDHLEEFGRMTYGLEWMMWTTLLKTTQWMIFAYHREQMGPMVGPLL